MDFVSFGRTSTTQQAKNSSDQNKIFFPTDSSAIILNKKEYGGVTTNILNSAVGNIESDVDDLGDDVALLRSELNAKQLQIGAVQTDAVPTEGSANHMTSGALYNAFQKVTETEVELLTTPVVIKPNILYKLGDRDVLDVSFIDGEQGIVNEYMFEFTVTSDSFTLTLPSSVKWTEEPDFQSGYTYQVSIVNNLALSAGWEV